MSTRRGVPAGFEVHDGHGLAIAYRDRRMAALSAGFTVFAWSTMAWIAYATSPPQMVLLVFAAAGLVPLSMALWFLLHRRVLVVEDGRLISGRRRRTSIGRDEITGFDIVKSGGWSVHGLSITYRSVDYHVIAKRRGGEETEVIMVARREHAEWVVAELERELRLRDRASAPAAGASN